MTCFNDEEMSTWTGHKDFYGNPVKHYSEMPGQDYTERVCYLYLPIEGYLAEMSLKAFEKDKDCICLVNRWGQIVKQWPDNYIPDHGEIRQAIIDTLRTEGRNII